MKRTLCAICFLVVAGVTTAAGLIAAQYERGDNLAGHGVSATTRLR